MLQDPTFQESTDSFGVNPPHCKGNTTAGLPELSFSMSLSVSSLKACSGQFYTNAESIFDQFLFLKEEKIKGQGCSLSKS